MKLATGCISLDELLSGGLESGAVTLVIGEAGTGKTNLCLQLSCQALRGDPGKVVYVDTEGVSLERLQQIAGADTERVLKNILFYSPASLEEQVRTIKTLDKIKDARLIVVDSLNLYYRLGLGHDGDTMGKLLTNMLGELLRLSRADEVPVLVTGQVYSGEEGSQAFGGRIMEHIVKAILRLERIGPGIRRASIVKHRSLPEGRQAEFYITQNGLAPQPAVL